ncbi:MAG: hypothetical protein ABSD38_28205 [Syntrophorhabdales bacterium]|jgi:hypothetical protein
MKLSQFRLYLLFTIVIPFALYANLRIINKEVERLHTPGRFEETVYEARLAPLKAMLPRDAVIGYVSTDDTKKDPQEHIKWFYVTRYDLCPLIVMQGNKYSFVIGAYYDITDRGGSETTGLSLVKDFGLEKDFGYGIRLYRGNPK